MNKILPFLALALAMPLHAQWSVKDDDPRPRNPDVLYQVFPKDDWNKSNFAVEKDLQWFRDATTPLLPLAEPLFRPSCAPTVKSNFLGASQSPERRGWRS